MSVMTSPITAHPHEPLALSSPQGLDQWLGHLRSASLTEVVPDAAAAAVFAVDMVNGVCRTGQLASARLAALVDPVADLFQRAHDRGVRDFVLLQDRHDVGELEFASYPAHGVHASWETDTVTELTDLPFAQDFTIIPKHSIHPALGTGLSRWLAEHPNLRTAMVVGAGTDLGVYQLAMHLRLRANALNLAGFEVIVPADAVAAHQQSVQGAHHAGALPHPDGFFHGVFLFHLALNGVRVVRSLAVEENGR